MKNDEYFQAEKRLREIKERQAAEEAAEREAAVQRHLAEIRRKPHCQPHKSGKTR